MRVKIGKCIHKSETNVNKWFSKHTDKIFPAINKSKNRVHIDLTPCNCALCKKIGKFLTIYDDEYTISPFTDKWKDKGWISSK